MAFGGMGPRNLVRAAALAVAVLGVGVAWTFSSPIGSSPDDDFHLASIWCSHPAPSATCVPTDPPVFTEIHAVLVPEAISDAAMCYRRHHTASGACPLSADPTTLAPSRTNDGEYPGGYYDLMGLFVSDRPLRSVLLMRIVNWVLAVGLVALAAFVAPARLRRTYLIGVIATCVPLGLFLLASNNPSGLTFAAVPAAWCAAMAHLEASTRRQSVVAAAVAALAVVAALISRADAGVYVAACAVVAITLSPTTRRTARVVGVAALVTLVAAIAFGYPSRIAKGFGASFDRPLGDVLWSNLVNLPSLWTGSIGTGKLGWLDTPMPGAVSVGVVSMVVALLVLGARNLDRRKATAVALLGVLLIAYPMYFLAESRSLVGENFQPRYLLPLLPVVVAVLLLPTGPSARPGLSRRAITTLGTVLVVAHAVALHTQIRRYVTGDDVPGLDLGRNVEWWWTGSMSPMFVWGAGSIAFAAAVAMIGKRWILLNDEEPAVS